MIKNNIHTYKHRFEKRYKGSKSTYKHKTTQSTVLPQTTIRDRLDEETCLNKIRSKLKWQYTRV